MINKTIIGKSSDFDLISNSIIAASNGNPGIIFISGPAGVGKSTFLQNIEFPQRFQVFETNVPEEESPSYSVIANLLRQTDIHKKPLNQNMTQVNDFIGYFLPEVNPKKGANANFDVLVSVFKKILEHLTENGPLVWIIEDLQWADIASLEVLANLYISATPLPFLLLATYRNEQISREHALRRIRAKLRRNRGFEEIELQPFTKKQIVDFIESTLNKKPSQELVDTLFYQTGGLPLLINEIMNTLLKRNLIRTNSGELQLEVMDNLPIPENIRDLVTLQMDELTPEARDLAEIAASYGIEFSFSFLEKFAISVNTIDELLEKGIIIEKKPGYGSFRHTLYRETIRSEIIWSKRKKIFHKIAKELEKQQISPAILADFYYKAGLIEKARPAYIQSARESCDLYAYHDAARWAEKALVDWPKGENEEERLRILEEFAKCSKNSGNLGNAIKALKEITESEISLSNEENLAKVYRELASCYGLKGSWKNYQQSRQKAIELFKKTGNLEDAALEQMDLAEHCYKELKISNALELIDNALENAGKKHRKDIYARCLALKGYLVSIYGDNQHGFDLANQAVSMALKQNNTLATAEAYRRLAGTLEYASAFRKSLKAYDLAFEFCNTNQLDSQETQCMSCMAWVLMRTGDWRKCFETCQRVIDHPGSATISIASANLILSILRAYRGELRTAKKNLKETFRIAEQENSNLHKLIAYWPASIISTIEGDEKKTYDSFCNMIDFWLQTEDRHDSIAAFCDAISFFISHNHVTELNKCINILTTIANQTKNPEAFGILSYAIGTSLSLNKQHEQAADHLEKALNYLLSVDVPLQSAIITFHLGLTYQNLELFDKADHAFSESYQTFKNLGVRYWCSVIDQHHKKVTKESKNHSKEVNSGPVSNLTVRQLEILGYLTTGMSNKEIAAKINLSTRTVDMHVRHIYDRLNCRTRTEAAKIALDTGLVKTHTSKSER